MRFNDGQNRSPLDRWIPRLLSLWRGNTDSRLPPDRCTREELRELTNSIRELTRGLGAARSFAGSDYMNDRRLLGAYLLYFWPVSYAQASWCLQQAGFSRNHHPRQALDVGCGPGPATAALLDCGAKAVTAIDHAGSALSMLRSLAGQSGPVTTLRGDIERDISVLRDRTFDCIIIGHALNELWASHSDKIQRRTGLIASLTRRLTPGGALVLFEPAAHATSRDVLAVRDALLHAGLVISAPCTMSAPCPALLEPSGMCHAAVSWSSPPMLQEISRAAGPHRDALKMSYLIVRPGNHHTPPSRSGRGMDTALPAMTNQPAYRVVSDTLVNKAGRLRMIICGPKGRFSLSADPRDTHPALHAMRSLHRGQAIMIDNPEPRGDGWAIGQKTTIATVPM